MLLINGPPGQIHLGSRRQGEKRICLVSSFIISQGGGGVGKTAQHSKLNLFCCPTQSFLEGDPRISLAYDKRFWKFLEEPIASKCTIYAILVSVRDSGLFVCIM